MFLCECGKEGLYFSKYSKRWRCQKSSNKCEAIKEKMIKARRALDPITGKTSDQIRIENAIRTKAQDRDADGNNASVRAAKKSWITKENTVLDNGMTIKEAFIQKTREQKNTVDHNSGLTVAQLAGKKNSKRLTTTILPNGLTLGQLRAFREALRRQNLVDGKTIGQIIAEKSAKTMAETFIDGKTIRDIRIQKQIETKLVNNSFEKAFFKSLQMHRFADTQIKFQGTYEKVYLEHLVALFGLEWLCQNVSRGPTIRYHYEGKKRCYFSDFSVDGLITEIKSTFTWNGKGKKLAMWEKNVCKINQTIQDFGAIVLVIGDGKLFSEYRLHQHVSTATDLNQYLISTWVSP